MSESIIGIDPGVSGGIVVVRPDHNIPLIVRKMPDTEVGILELLSECDYATHAYLEWIHPAIQNIGKSQMSKLYGNYMGLRMALFSASIPFDTARAQDWQRGLGITKRGKTETQTKWKNRLKAEAMRLFPEKRTGIKITLWNCDAMLIAEYGRRVRDGAINKNKGVNNA